MSAIPEKLCKTCAWYEETPLPGDSMGTYARCRRRAITPVSPVTGSFGEEEKRDFCRAVRETGFPLDVLFGLCGKRGRYWEPGK